MNYKNNIQKIPKEVKDIIEEFTFFKPKTKDELKKAVNLWNENRDEALKKYAHISNWDTSLIEDMSYLFLFHKEFNEDISNWNVSNVKNMEDMFHFCHSFNQSLNIWDVSKVENIKYMFCKCSKFNQPLNDWNVSNV